MWCWSPQFCTYNHKLLSPLFLSQLHLLDGQVVALLGVGHHQHLPREELSLLGEDRLREETPDLVPVSEGLGGGRAQPDGVVGPDEGHVEPEGNAVDGAGLEHVELQRDLNPVQVRLVRSLQRTQVELPIRMV